MITIERMAPEQVSQVAELERQCFSLPWDEASVASELDNPLSLWLTAMDGQSLAGYVGSQAVMGEADMMNLAVKEEYRRQGIACELVHALVSALKQEQIHCLTLEVRASNASARALYAKLGFEQVGCRPNYYSAPKEDALILRKEWDL